MIFIIEESRTETSDKKYWKMYSMCNKIFLLGRFRVYSNEISNTFNPRPWKRIIFERIPPDLEEAGGRARNRKRFGREPNPESRKIRHVKRAATFSYLTDYLSSFNSIKNRRVKRAEPGIPPVVKSAPLPLPCRRLLFYPPSPPPLRPPEEPLFEYYTTYFDDERGRVESRTRGRTRTDYSP